MIIRKFAIGFLLLLFALGCSEERKENPSTFTVLDKRGLEVPFPKIPDRVVSLVPSVTEVVFALGAQRKLVGVTTFCNYPPEAKSKPKVGDFSNPSLERIMNLRPDVVFATIPEQSPVIERLEKLGLKVFVIEPETVEGVLTSIEKMGKILGKATTADSIVKSIWEDLEQVSSLLHRIKKRRKVYLEISMNPIMTISQHSFVGELLSLAGGINIATGSKPYLMLNSEAIIAANPEVILIAHPATTPEQLKNRLGWEKISAVQENRVYRVDADLVLRPGPRIAEGVREFFKKIYPELAREASVE